MTVVLRLLNGRDHIIGVVPKADSYTARVSFPVQTTEGVISALAHYVRHTSRIIYYQEVEMSEWV